MPDTALAGLGSIALDLPSNTNLGADLSQAGLSFGSMIQGVGNAVAQTQRKLTETSAASASALANAQVDVIAVQETIYDDQGNISGQVAHNRKLPLIDFIDPVFYQWSQVRLQGRFFVSEIATASTASSFTDTSHDSDGQHGLLVIFGGGHNNFDFTDTTTSESRTSDTASAVGVARLYAQLNPRSDIGVPKPTQVVQGPSLNIVEGEIKDVGGPPATSRTMSLLIQLHRQDGTPINGKAVSVETDGIPWSFSGSATTDASGNVTIVLERTFLPDPPAPAPPTDRSPKSAVVTVRLGLISNNTTVTF